MKLFDVISAIDVADPASWEGKIFLTFDIDWAHDDVLADAITLVEAADVPATWFVTHDTPLLARLRSNPKFELGIHPNFNDLLSGRHPPGDSEERVITALKTLVPEARSVRSHSLVQSERLVDRFHAHGLRAICNYFIPESAGRLSPWKLWSDMMIIPHCWQDNVSMRLHGTVQPPPAVASGGLKVFDFHPIHVFLNSENMARYESARPCFQKPDELLRLRSDHPGGARNLLKQLLEAA